MPRGRQFGLLPPDGAKLAFGIPSFSHAVGEEPVEWGKLAGNVATVIGKFWYTNRIEGLVSWNLLQFQNH